MPAKLTDDENKNVSVRLTPQQLRDVDYLVRVGRIGSSRPEIVRHFLVLGLEQYETDKKLGAPNGGD